MNYRELNAKTIDQWCLEGWEWGQPISHEQLWRQSKVTGRFC